MAAQNLRRHVFMGALTPQALSAGDVVLMRVGIPIKIMRVGVIVTTTINSTATGFNYAFDRRPTPGSDTGRVEMVEMTGAVAEDQAAGKVIRRKVGTPSTESGSSVLGVQGTGKVTSGQSDGHVCNVGDEIVFEVTTAADTAAGAGVPFFEYILLGANDGDGTSVADDDIVDKTA